MSGIYGSEQDFLDNMDSITVGSNVGAKFFARNPGEWGNEISIAIANPIDFGDEDSEAFEGINLQGLFEYFPDGGNNEIGVVIREGSVIKEVFLVSLNKDSRDVSNKSNYIETLINRQSNLVFVKHGADGRELESCIGDDAIGLNDGSDGSMTEGDLIEAYELWENKEEVDIDIVIGNEFDMGKSAIKLTDTRKDCIAFVGASEEIVGKKAAAANTQAIADRGDLGDSMFACFGGNYKYQYDRYNDKNRWINIAGDIAGLRAQTSSSRASWWASAGLDRGQIKNAIKLAYNPNQAQRDQLYKAGVNPIVTFPGQGTVMWGQKTMQSKPSSFDRVNVRGLFNTLERSLSKMAKYQVMEFNDNFTRNRIVSMIKPFLSTVQAGRGIQDFLVICDSSNNTPDVISRNQLIVDVYIKPTYVAEFLLLRFTNAGTNNFSEVIGG